MAQPLTDHTIEPRKKTKKVSKKITPREKTIDQIDSDDVTRTHHLVAAKEVVKGKKRVLTAEHKRKMREGREWKRRNTIATKPIIEESGAIKLGDDMYNVPEPGAEDKSIVVQPAPHIVELHNHSDPVSHLREGTQLITERREENILQLFDYDVVNIAKGTGVEEVEHSSAYAMDSQHFLPPTRPVFDQHVNYTLRGMQEFPRGNQGVELRTKNVAFKLGQYENLLETQERSSYIRENSSRSAHVDPALQFEYVQAAPARDGPPSFIRSIRGGTNGFRDVPTDTRIQ
jgi:hypothetical protein